MPEYQDKEVQCSITGCPNTFTISAHTQRALAAKGWDLPKRCVPHRQEKKAYFAQREKDDEERRKREGSPFHPTHIKGYSPDKVGGK